MHCSDSPHTRSLEIAQSGLFSLFDAAERQKRTFNGTVDMKLDAIKPVKSTLTVANNDENLVEVAS